MDYSIVFKIVVIGDSHVGKSSVVERYVDKSFSIETDSTIGVDFFTKNVTLYGVDRTIKLHIWDTAGHERFHALTNTYFRNAAGCMLVYDSTNANSADSLQKWFNAVRANSLADTVGLVVGNKSDLNSDPDSTANARAREFADNNELPIVYASACLGDGVNEAFELLARLVYDKLISPTLDGGMVVEPSLLTHGFYFRSAPVLITKPSKLSSCTC